MYYDVFIPSNDPDGFDVTITVDASNWMSALKSGLERTGEGADSVRNVMCDIKEDNTIHVTDATTQRVFVLKEISEEEYEKNQREGEDVVRHEDDASGVMEPSDAVSESAAQVQPEHVRPEQTEQPAQEQPAREEQPGVQEQQEAQPAAQPQEAAEPVAQEQEQPKPSTETQQAQDEDEHSFVSRDGMRIGSSTYESLSRESEEEDAKVVREKRERTDQRKSVEIGRQNEKVSESLIEDVFLEIQAIHEGDMGMEEVVNFCMDMAMDKMEPESGSVLFADVNGRELYFATARGPKSDEVMDYRVPMGTGVAGFCAREGVSLAISDVERDPRFHKEISEAIGYETKNLICAPVQHENRVYGCIELLNKKRSSAFDSNEMNALSYIARQLGKFVYDEIMQSEKLAHEK
ncbi:MAG: GAF domain-containing protein [Myxococcota bacterium]